MNYSSLLLGLQRFLHSTEKKEIFDYLDGKINDESKRTFLKQKENAMITEILKGNGEWWKSLFPQERAYMQYNCDVLILPLRVYLSDVESLLGKKVNIIKLLNTDKYAIEINIKFYNWLKIVKEDY